jgi:dUTP pyrophosphatase
MLQQPIKVPVINRSGNPLPEYATAGSSGMDLRAWISNDIELKPLERTLVPTGISIALPEGYEAQVRPRSGLAIRHGITCLNTPGTIDADYRGEIGIILINLSNETQVIRNGERIAQIVFQKVEKISWQATTGIEDSARGAGGFGHTGKH